MEKTNVIKALEMCNIGEDCIGCPYYGADDCTKKLHADAIAWLKANDIPKVNAPKYTMVYIYTKKGNLLPYFTATVRDKSNTSLETLMRIEEYYAIEREIQLIAMFRWEKDRCFCKIKCPVNPLPVKGEFEIPSISAIDKFFKANGWTFKQEVFPRMFM